MEEKLEFQTKSSKIRISNEKFEAPEILFHPFLIQNESPGVHEMLFNSINVSKFFYNFS